VELLKDFVLLESDSLKNLLLPFYGRLLELRTQFSQNSYIGNICQEIFIYLFTKAKTKEGNGVGLVGLDSYRKQVLEDSEVLKVLPREASSQKNFKFVLSGREIRSGHMAQNTVVGNIIIAWATLI